MGESRRKKELKKLHREEPKLEVKEELDISGEDEDALESLDSFISWFERYAKDLVKRINGDNTFVQHIEDNLKQVTKLDYSETYLPKNILYKFDKIKEICEHLIQKSKHYNDSWDKSRKNRFFDDAEDLLKDCIELSKEAKKEAMSPVKKEEEKSNLLHFDKNRPRKPGKWVRDSSFLRKVVSKLKYK